MAYRSFKGYCINLQYGMVLATCAPVLLYLRQNPLIGKTYQTQKMYRFKRLDQCIEKPYYLSRRQETPFTSSLKINPSR